MSVKVALDFTEITRRLKTLTLPDVDVVIGIATGGTVPASLVAYRLGVPLTVMQINYRAPDNTPQRAAPELLSSAPLLEPERRVLLVDDVSVSGQTLDTAKALLDGHKITTLVMKGQADYVVFPDVETCVRWPWKTE